MLRTRVIPVLLLREDSLVKTVRFKSPTYVGDPSNTVRIFNEFEVDELILLDTTATVDGREPNIELLKSVANESFMPLAYGGAIRTVEQAKTILGIGFEKVVVNSAALQRPELISELAERFGSQAVIVSVDVRRRLFGRQAVVGRSATQSTALDPVHWSQRAQALGAGELLITSVDREGTWTGFDLDLLRAVTGAVTVPVIAHGGAGSVSDIGQAVRDGGASAVAVGSMVVFQKQGMGVLVNFPAPGDLAEALRG